ncbi:MAG: tyrosine-protein phosphatase [Actinomycetota bacterium]
MTPAPSSLPALEGVLNFRDMAGLTAPAGTIPSATLLRSGHLAEATDADLQSLAPLGIRSVVDFRQDADRLGDGGADRLPPDAEQVLLPVADPGGAGAEFRQLLTDGDGDALRARFGDGQAHARAVEQTAVQATEPAKQATYAAFLRHVVDAEGPLLFHCSAGKDRAGWAATLIGIALGVDDDQLMEHYLLSNVHRPVEQRVEYYRSRGVDAQVILPFLRVDADYLQAALDAVDASWPTRETYLADALDFNGDDIERLREKYLV